MSVPTIFPACLEMTSQDVSDTRSVSTATATGNSNVTAENHLLPAMLQQETEIILHSGHPSTRQTCSFKWKMLKLGTISIIRWLWCQRPLLHFKQTGSLLAPSAPCHCTGKWYQWSSHSLYCPNSLRSTWHFNTKFMELVFKGTTGLFNASSASFLGSLGDYQLKWKVTKCEGPSGQTLCMVPSTEMLY